MLYVIDKSYLVLLFINKKVCARASPLKEKIVM